MCIFLYSVCNIKNFNIKVTFVVVHMRELTLARRHIHKSDHTNSYIRINGIYLCVEEGNIFISQQKLLRKLNRLLQTRYITVAKLKESLPSAFTLHLPNNFWSKLSNRAEVELSLEFQLV